MTHKLTNAGLHPLVTSNYSRKQSWHRMYIFYVYKLKEYVGSVVIFNVNTAWIASFQSRYIYWTIKFIQVIGILNFRKERTLSFFTWQDFSVHFSAVCTIFETSDVISFWPARTDSFPWRVWRHRCAVHSSTLNMLKATSWSVFLGGVM